MIPTSPAFKDNARAALADPQLQRALASVAPGLAARRGAARAGLPEFEALRERGREIKDHTLAHLDLYLEAFERKAADAGASVHFAPTAADAREIILEICRSVGARIVTKGKSMISEEIGLNACLEAGGIETVETDLGEYLIQIRGETPSHIIAPAIHLTQDQVEADFRRRHTNLPKERVLVEPTQLVAEA
ncbi:MAG TPA: LUD domain-containing protein, partial [Hyphomicrobiaceae bacterium]|nr:LUD domain-containing protein [Hyphomicrobiaceae bacterium]